MLNIYGGQFVYNEALTFSEGAGYGGAIFIDNAILNVYDSDFDSNYASRGGVLSVRAGVANIYGSYMYNNTSPFGAVMYAYDGGTLNIFDGKFTEWLRCVAADHNTGVQIPHLPFTITIFRGYFYGRLFNFNSQ